MKALLKISAISLCLIMIFALAGCGGGKIEGTWKTRPQVDESGNVTAVNPEDVQLFEFRSSGEGNMSLPEFGETVVISFSWKTKGKTLTITSEDEVYKFKYKVKNHILYLTPAKGDVTYEYIKVNN